MSIVPRLYKDFNLTGFTTLQLQSTVSYYAPIYQISDIKEILSEIFVLNENKALPYHVLGGGSNLVLRENINCIALHSKLTGKRLIGETASEYFVEIAAGENWDEAVTWTLENGFNGLENLISIPGTVGAAPIQNIGAYGLEVSSRISEVKGIYLNDFSAWSFHADDCDFSYRDSRFKKELRDKVFITSVVFRLPKKYELLAHYPDVNEIYSKSPEKTAKALAAIIASIRQKKLPDPAKIPNAGSFYKNPVIKLSALETLQKKFSTIPHYAATDSTERKIAAAWLIEQCGWKGRSIGPIGMYEKQALVLVNKGGATYSDVSKVEKSIQDDVFKKFNLTLEREPVVW